MLDHLVDRLGVDGVAYVLPAAAGNTWYPDRFNAPRAANEPWLGHALEACAATAERIGAAGIRPEQTVLAGFSQGACLIADFAAREPRGWGGVAVLTGALIGPDDDVTEVGPSPGVPVLLVTSRVDRWVPVERVEATAQAFQAAGARVTLRVNDDPEHRIDDEAVAGVRAMVSAVAGGEKPSGPEPA